MISTKTRWIAGITGCATAIAGLPVLGYLSVILGAFLILGAVLANYAPRHARDLVWFGAGTISLATFPIAGGILKLSLSGGRDPRVVLIAVTMIVLLTLCDAVVILDAIRVHDSRVGTHNQ
jgi:hypothetical protein